MKKLMSKQQIFDKVAKHLLTQKKKALRSGTSPANGICTMYTKEGLRCAVGCLIPKTTWKLNPNVAIQTPSDPGLKLLLEAYGVVGEEKLLLDLMQVHDSEDVKNWKKCLKQVALNNGLKMPVVK